MLVLVDMDGPICDFETAVAREVTRRGFDPVPFDGTYRHFHAAANYRERYGPLAAATVLDIIDAPGFYASLPAVHNVRMGLGRLVDAGHDVWICTAPRLQNPTCASDKLDWVRQHLGADWMRRVIVCRDKTLVHGDVLIDDRPEVTGTRTPTWSHVLWDAPYNRHLETPGGRLCGWDDVDRLLESLARTRG